MNEHYRQKPEELCQELGTCPEGLSSETAAKHLEQYGKNAIAEAKKKPTWLIFLEQFKDFLVIILIIAAPDLCIYRRFGKLYCYYRRNHHECDSGNGADRQGGKVALQSEKAVVAYGKGAP